MKHYPIKTYTDLLEREGLLVSSDVADPSKTVRGLSFDSRNVPDGSLFIVKGVHFKDEYLADAFASGAVAYVAEKKTGDYPGCITVSDMRSAMALLAKTFYNNPIAELQTFAMTGTKGKTTTAAFLRRILDFDAAEKNSPKTGIICSVDIWDGIRWTEPINTTPEAPDIWKYFAAGVESGLRRFVLEVSSQALKYKRVEGMTFDIACFTNVGFDHIGPSEHTDFEDYLNSKLSIFDRCRLACVNADDEYCGRMIEKIGGRYRTVTFGESEGAEVRMTCLRKENDGIHFTVTVPGDSRDIRLTMPGMFNAKNALSAIAMAYAGGVSLETCAAALEQARVKGRMLSYGTKDGKVTVLIDYAHNGMSFSTLFDSLEQEYPGCAYVTVYGWHGNKGQNRRHDIGVVTGARADFTVITEKDSADEKFEDIAAEAAHWISSVGGKYAIVKDREDALRYAFDLDVGDRRKIIVFAGRGEEDWQKWGSTYYKYKTDPDITADIIAGYDRTH